MPPETHGGKANGGKAAYKGAPAGNPGNKELIHKATAGTPVESGGKVEFQRTPVWDVPTNEAWAGSLTSAEHDTISTWKGSATGIRAAYAKGQHNIPGTAAYHNYSALLKSAPHEGVVYRGIHGAYAIEVAKAAIAAGAGGEWTDVSPHGFSPNPHIAQGFSYGDVIIRAHVKSARPIHKAGGFKSTDAKGEMEVIGLPGTKYKIKSVAHNVTTVDPVTGRNVNVKHVIDVEEI